VAAAARTHLAGIPLLAVDSRLVDTPAVAAARIVVVPQQECPAVVEDILHTGLAGGGLAPG